MTKKFEINLTQNEVGKRVRAILGVPDVVLTDEVISSQTFIKKTELFINRQIKDYVQYITEETDYELLKVSAMYYLSYLLCAGMTARLPKQMENLSTKTILQNINWDAKALEMLEKAKESISDFLSEYDIDEVDYSMTFVDLSDEMEYPEASV
jgi:hypothetical protein